MTQRDIGTEIISGLEKIAAWEKGEIELKTIELKLPKASDVVNIRKGMGVSSEVFAYGCQCSHPTSLGARAA